MTFGKFLGDLRQDVFKILLELKSRGKTYTSISQLGVDIYQIYRYVHKNQEELDLLMVQRLLGLLYEDLSEIGALHTSGIDDDYDWVEFYTWDPNDEKHEEISESCSVRFYLNVKYEHMKGVFFNILRTFSKSSKPLMFKFYSPQLDDMVKINSVDKVVFYIHPDLVDDFIKKLESISDDFFNPQRPLFTKKIKAGVGMAYETKKDFPFARFISRITQDQIDRFSYGSYMAFILARAFILLLAQDGTGSVKSACFVNFDEDYLKRLVPRTMVLISRMMREDLEMNIE